MRVLHLIDSGFRAGQPRRVVPDRAWVDLAVAWAALLSRRIPCHQDVCFLGPRSALERAQASGLRIDLAAAPTAGEPALAAPALEQWAAGRDIGIVHCW